MIRRTLARFGIDPYLLALLGTVAVAIILPARGQGAVVANDAVSVAVALLFFLYGARLSPKAVWEGLLHWRLQSLVFASTYILFPVLGLGLTKAFGTWLSPTLILGLMFVCVLPSTVQSSIAFTSIARGNVAAALCSASVSNLFGMVVTPLLVMLLLDSKGVGFSGEAMKSIALQLLLPFAIGQLLRPWIGSFLQRYKSVISIVDRGSILLVVYDAFSEGMAAGIWSQVTVSDLVVVILLDMVLLAAVLAITTIVSRRLGFAKEDEIVIVFCGSKKSLASGIPMANILFPGQALGLIVLPLMLFHQIQLFACATLAQRYARRPAESRPEPLPSAVLDPAKA
ncbi:bile acid:sodium symporter family protein [Bosea sp. AS-1]|uniref:bile acid:sodium symporter family protein n=1 Tax=Bosea sp. AS-1 TaxID=2015316 RepID=UPI000B7716E3|nr:bile acid:sodium symporter family protein [Bosea sp. AS-1]